MTKGAYNSLPHHHQRMSSHKLRLKRTPAEQAEHDLRKARKAARKAAKHKHRDDDYERDDYKRKRRRTDDDGLDEFFSTHGFEFVEGERSYRRPTQDADRHSDDEDSGTLLFP